MGRSLDEIRASRPKVDWDKVRSTTEADIARHAAEDDSEPAGPLSAFVKRLPGQRGPSRKGAMVSVTIRIPADAEARWRSVGENWRESMRDALVRAAPKVTDAA